MIDRFGGYPQRTATLGGEITPAEDVFPREPRSSFQPGPPRGAARAPTRSGGFAASARLSRSIDACYVMDNRQRIDCRRMRS
jgi:hypothetical protein